MTSLVPVSWIVLRDGDNAGASAPAIAPVVCEKVPSSELNERQQWALRQLGIGVKLQRVMLERKFNIAEKTAKRDLADLSGRNAIEFVRSGRERQYRLVPGNSSDHVANH